MTFKPLILSNNSGDRLRYLATAILSIVILFNIGGCAEQHIRDASQEAIEHGDYDQGVNVLEDGLRRYPGSTLLRSGLLVARSDAIDHYFASAKALRAAGKIAEARQEIGRAKVLDPQNSRVNDLMAELDIEQRQIDAVTEAESWIAKQRSDLALKTIARGLKENPRYEGLLTLQRRIELEQRTRQQSVSQSALAETRSISLDFRDANLRTVLDVVSRNSGINFILDKDIRADVRVTVYLQKATVEEALDLITSTNQLSKKVLDAKTIVVYPNTPEKQRDYQEQVVKVFYLVNAQAKGAAAFLKSMLKIREPFVDERSNMLSVRESQDMVQLAERLIQLYDANEPEVVLEVEVLEIDTTKLTDLGVHVDSPRKLGHVHTEFWATGLRLDSAMRLWISLRLALWVRLLSFVNGLVAFRFWPAC